MDAHPTAGRMTRRDWFVALALVLVALVPRVAGYARYEYKHDELKMVQRYIRMLDEAVDAGDVWGFVVDVPLSCSTSITPLWGWIQWASSLVLDYDRVATRVPQIAVSLTAVLLAYVLVRRVLGRTHAVVAASAFAISDLCIWTGVKSEFPEPMLLCALMGGMIGMLSDRWRTFALGAACLGIAPLVHFGKGGFLYALVGLWLLVARVVDAVRAERGDERRAVVRRSLGQVGALALSLLPTLVWLGLAVWRTTVREHGEVDLGTLRDGLSQFVEWVRVLTVDYFEYRPFMKEDWRSMLLVYTFLPVWPTAVLMAPWAAVGTWVGLERLRSESDPVRQRLLLALPTMGIVPFVYTVANGFQAARFTLLYHVPFAIACALAVDEVLRRLREGRGRALAAALLAVPFGWIALTGSLTSWTRWEVDGGSLVLLALAGALVVALGVVGSARVRWLAWLPLAVWVIVATTSLARFGPLQWARSRAFAVEGRMAAEHEETLRSEFPEGDGYLFLRR